MLLKDAKLYYVGGVVRDELLGTTSFDTDFCYEGNAIEFAKEKGLHIIKENPAFGTVRVIIDNKEIDIASTREESYPRPGHLPLVKNIGCPLKNDLKRRDFTINAIAKNTKTGVLVDYFDGIKDIENKQLKILHKHSFIDDPTRILRGLKFSVRFGFELEQETKSLQEKYLNNINYDMSYHRLKKELMETFNLNKGEAFDKFINQKIYKLLSQNISTPNIRGDYIQNIVKLNGIENPWIIYLGMLDISDLPLEFTRKEKSILDWTKKLKTQKENNNTPKESLVIYKLLNEELC